MALPAIIPIATAVIGAASSVHQTIQANKRAKEAQRAIEEFREQKLINYAQLVGAPTKSAELELEKQAQRTATQLAQVEKLGSRGVIGAAPVIAQQDVEVTERIGARIQDLQNEYSRYAAEGAFRVQQTQEERERQALAGYGQQLNVARQERAAGIQGIAKSGLAAAQTIASLPQQGATTPATTPVAAEPSAQLPPIETTSTPGGPTDTINPGATVLVDQPVTNQYKDPGQYFMDTLYGAEFEKAINDGRLGAYTSFEELINN